MEDRIQQFKQEALLRGYSPQEVDAFIAQQIGGQTSTQPQPTQSEGLVGKVGKGAMSVVDSLAKPFVNTGKNVGLLGQIAASKALEKFNPQLAAKVASADVLGSQERAQNISDNPEDAFRQQVGDSLSMGAFAVPFGKGAGVVKQALLPGAAVGALTSDETANLLTGNEVSGEDLLGSAIIGAVTAGALKAAGGLLKKTTGDSAVSAGREMQKSGLKPQTRTSPKQFLDEEQMLNEAQRLGLKGSGKQMNKQMGELYTQLSNDLTDAVEIAKTKGRPLHAETLKRQIEENIGENFVVETPAQRRLIENILKKIGISGKKGGLTPQDFAEINRKIGAPGGRLSNAMKKVRSGGTLTEADQAYLSAYEVVNRMFKQKVSGVESILKDMSVLHDLASGIGKAASETMQIPLLGARVGSGLLQKVKGSAGRGLETAGNAIKAASKALNEFVPPAAAQQLIPQAAIRQMTERGPEQVVESTPEEQITSSLSAPQEQTSTITGFTATQLAQAYSQAVIAGDTNAAKQLKSLYELEQEFSPQEQGGAEATALNVVQELEQMFNQVQSEGLTASAPGISSRLVGGAKGKYASISENSPTAAAYDRQRKAFISLVVRGLGERGVLTDQDVNRVVAAIPTFSTSPQAAKVQWDTVKSILSKAGGDTQAQDALNALQKMGL